MPPVESGAVPDPMIIAIDGPSGVGKGTVACAVAGKLGLRHIDTGAMYRAIAWLALRDGRSLDDEEAMAALADRASIVVGDGRISIDGVDVSHAIRTAEIDAAVSHVARLPRVRAVLVRRQRALGAGPGLVMEGRDIGSVVFPDADVKIYLDASPEERARRRASDPVHAAGQSMTRAEVAVALETRDLADRTRAASPLTIARDAIVIDTTGVPIAEVVRRVLEIVAARD
jgi:cytidylate kinase